MVVLNVSAEDQEINILTGTVNKKYTVQFQTDTTRSIVGVLTLQELMALLLRMQPKVRA